MRLFCFGLIVLLILPQSLATEERLESTRITDEDFHKRKGPHSYPYREWSEFILEELDIRSGDVVLDVGAGDGWWSERFYKKLNNKGKIYALEVDQEKVEKMKKKFAKIPQIVPYHSESDHTGLDENTCDLVFFSQVYHHLDEGTQEDYLRHLKKVVKPNGRLCIIERYSKIAIYNPDHATPLSTLVKQAEEAGWILVRYELMRGTNHYLSILVQQDLFGKKDEDKNIE